LGCAFLISPDRRQAAENSNSLRQETSMLKPPNSPAQARARRYLPNRRLSIAFTFEFESHRYRATASRFDDGDLAEIFLDTEKAGTPLQLNAETAAILASLCLQHGVDAKTIMHSVNGPIAVALDYFTTVEVL
jgi:hypothetical protein